MKQGLCGSSACVLVLETGTVDYALTLRKGEYSITFADMALNEVLSGMGHVRLESEDSPADAENNKCWLTGAAQGSIFRGAL